MQLGNEALLTPLIQRREHLPRTEASAAVVKSIQRARSCDQPEDPAALAPTGPATAPGGASKRKRCHICPPKKDCKRHTMCCRCKKYICKGFALAYYPTCANWGFSEGGTL